ncbi:TIGR03621 family F420-dependent LLM class oxidoreductase [Streptomyces sp. NRRL S-646]|uniref:TIGR03621 family F420-dependent LLM class oxidoreductase n=1 Tax=Streptomyces sp. NRRL S-646 TaxID=1463917 RepID=UPI00056C0709|nr:TIGR03621 family F420-dependent LLM class oxidoreductase [Streptomyces sp. NRRL S-646]
MRFRFGIQFIGARTRDEWVEAARRAEALGFSSFVLPDHFGGGQLAPMPALMAAADATSTLRLGTLVLCNDFRHPVMLAQEAATLDLLSDGRLELGMGAGWMRAEYDAVDLPFDPAATRVERLEESVQIVRGVLDEGKADFTGKHYRVSGFEGAPEPAQAKVPILVGGGSPRILRLAGRHADIVGVHHDLRAGEARVHDITPEGTERKLAWVREGAGERFPEIELQVGVGIFWVTPRPHTVLDGLSRRLGMPPETLATLPNVLVGSVSEMAEKILEQRERFGISYIVIQGRDMEAAAPLVSALSGC